MRNNSCEKATPSTFPPAKYVYPRAASRSTGDRPVSPMLNSPVTSGCCKRTDCAAHEVIAKRQRGQRDRPDYLSLTDSAQPFDNGCQIHAMGPSNYRAKNTNSHMRVVMTRPKNSHQSMLMECLVPDAGVQDLRRIIVRDLGSFLL